VPKHALSLVARRRAATALVLALVSMLSFAGVVESRNAWASGICLDGFTSSTVGGLPYCERTFTNTSGTTITVPDGVTEVNVVLQGGAGGKGGDDGMLGGDGGVPDSLQGTMSVSGGVEISIYPGGAGSNGNTGALMPGGRGGISSVGLQGGDGGDSGGRGSSGSGGGGGAGSLLRVDSVDLAIAAGGGGGGGGGNTANGLGEPGVSGVTISGSLGEAGEDVGGLDGGGGGGGGGGIHGGAGGLANDQGAAADGYVYDSGGDGGNKGQSLVPAGFSIDTGSGAGFATLGYVPINRILNVQLTSPGVSPSSTTAFEFTVTFSDVVTGFSAANVSLGGSSGTSGSWTKSVTGSGNTWVVSVSNSDAVSGDLNITLTTTSLTDSDGRALVSTSTTSPTVVIDRTAPTFASIDFTPDSSNAGKIFVTATFSETVTISDPGAVAITGTSGTWTIESQAANGNTVVIGVSSSGLVAGTIEVSFPVGFVSDSVGNSLETSETASATISLDSASVTTFSPSAAISRQADIEFSIGFDQSVFGLTGSDFAYSSSEVTCAGEPIVTGSGANYNVTTQGC